MGRVWCILFLIFALVGCDKIQNKTSKVKNTTKKEQNNSKKHMKVYIVVSYESYNVCSTPQINGIKKALIKKYGKNVSFKVHFMNTKTINANKKAMQKDAAIVLREIKVYKPNIVFTVDDNAFREVGLKLNKASFPVVFTGMNGQPEKYNKKVRFLDEKHLPCTNITGVYEKLHISTSINVIKNIIPKLHHVLVLLDRTPTGNAIKIQIEKELKANPVGKIKVEIQQLGTDEEYQKVLQRINKDPNIGAVYNALLSITRNKKKITINDIFYDFLKKSKKPSMALNFHFIKLGFFGGASVDFSAMGQESGLLGIALLEKTPIKNLPIKISEQTIIAFNLARAKMLNITISNEILAVGRVFKKMELLENGKK